MESWLNRTGGGGVGEGWAGAGESAVTAESMGLLLG